MSLEEYHVRQLVNDAKNQKAQSALQQREHQQVVQEIRAHVESAMALLDDETNAKVMAELQSALQKLGIIRRS